MATLFRPRSAPGAKPPCAALGRFAGMMKRNLFERDGQPRWRQRARRRFQLSSPAIMLIFQQAANGNFRLHCCTQRRLPGLSLHRGDRGGVAVVLVHGFSSDRVNSSALARPIAQNGYGVLAIDVRGHGENRNSFLESTSDDGLREDVKNAVEFLRNSNLVDGSRIVVMGHSMGAGATLDYATHDPSIKGSVMISGGFNLDRPERPRNTLFIFAQNDPSPFSNLNPHEFISGFRTLW
jgi:pimeloyl-ACP methyl ester carboxylesterase